MSADGNWKATIQSPLGAQESALQIVTNGDTFTGMMEGRGGAQEISGKVEGNTLTWSAAIKTPVAATLEFTVAVDGDKMSGSVKAGAFGTSPLTGVRV